MVLAFRLWLINYKIAGSPFAFLEYEEKYWFQTSQMFFKTVGGLWDIINGSYSVSTKLSAFIPGLCILLGMYGILIAGLKKQRTMYSVWLLVYLVVNTTMSWPLSLCRYLSCAVPIFITVGYWCDNNKGLYTAVTIASSVLMGIYLVGYLMAKQIM